jgi:hypothetical protein
VEAALDGVCGAHRFALIRRFVTEAGEEFVEVVAQAGDGVWILVFEAVGEAACGGAGLRALGAFRILWMARLAPG